MAKAVRAADWESLLAHVALLQTKLPGAVLVGGTAAAVHARHRFSVHAGLRNQRRSAPLETTTIELPGRHKLKLPTVEEMLRIKTYLTVERNATRDYLDTAALSYHLGLRKSAQALDRMNELYAEFAGEGGDMLSTVVIRLSNPEPYDLSEVDLREYKGIVAPWNDWHAVASQCRALAVAVVELPPEDSSY